jgi:CRP-like cAMP-binding protein
VLFTAGETAEGAYIVQQGSFSLLPEQGSEAEVLAGPGTLLGESALLAETRRPATATAREDATVLRISRTMFLRMLDGYPDAAQRLREVIAARADQWERDMANVRGVLAPGAKPK